MLPTATNAIEMITVITRAAAAASFKVRSALMSSLATGGNWVLIPERPPATDDWPQLMCSVMRAGRASKVLLYPDR